MEGFGLAVQVGQHQFDIAAELPEDLPAGAAGRRQHVGIGGHRDAAELARAFGDGFEDGHALGAEGQAVGGVFDVAAGVDAAVDVFQRRADLEVRERRMGVFAGRERGFDQRVRSCLQARQQRFEKSHQRVAHHASPVSSTSS